MRRKLAVLCLALFSTASNAAVFTVNFQAKVKEITGDSASMAGVKVDDLISGHFIIHADSAGSDTLSGIGAAYNPKVEWIGSSIDQFGVFNRSKPDSISGLTKRDYALVADNHTENNQTTDRIKLFDWETALAYERKISLEGGVNHNTAIHLPSNAFKNEKIDEAIEAFLLLGKEQHLNGSYLNFAYKLGAAEKLKGFAEISSISAHAVAPVPLPAAGWMFLTAVLGGAVVARKRRQVA